MNLKTILANKLPSILITISSLLFAVVFFAFGRNLILATQVLFVASLLTGGILLLCWRWVMVKKTEWGTIGVTVLFTGLTVFLNDENFILWRPTITNGLIGLGLILLFFLNKAPLEAILGKPLELNLPKEIWVKVNLIWGLYMLFCALINTVIVLFFSKETWMIVKTFVIPGLSFVFMLGLFAYLFKEHKNMSKNVA